MSVARDAQTVNQHAAAPHAGDTFDRMADLIGRGFVVIPLDYPDPHDPDADPKKPMRVGGRNANGTPKRLAWKQYQTRHPTPDEYERWFGNGRPVNMGIICGVISGIVAADFDSTDAEAEWLRAGRPLSPLQSRTAKGKHVIFRHPGATVPNKARITIDGQPIAADVRGDGGFIVAPGSVHASGVRYEWIGDANIPTDNLPVFDLTWIARPAKSATTRRRVAPAPAGTEVERDADRYVAKMGPAIEGHGGDAHAYRVAARLWDFIDERGLSVAAGWRIFSAWNHTCQPPWSSDELDTKWHNAERYRTGGTLDTPRARDAGPSSDSAPDRTTAMADRPVTPRAGRRFPNTDTGNAEYFAALYGDTTRFDHRRQRWLVWHEHHWQPDADADVQRRAKAAVRHRQKDAFTITDTDKRTAALKWASASEGRGKLDALLTLARAERPIADAGDGWDADPWLLGCPNGVINLWTGDLRSGRAEDRITMQTRVPYDPTARAPRWRQYVADVLEDDDRIAFVQRAAGYSLTGLTGEQCWFLCVGSGSNGKGTLLHTLGAVVGDYAYNMPFTTIELAQRSVIPNDLGRADESAVRDGE